MKSVLFRSVVELPLEGTGPIGSYLLGLLGNLALNMWLEIETA